MQTALTGQYSANHYSTPACHTWTKRYIGPTLAATQATLWPLLCQISNLFPVMPCSSDLTLIRYSYSTLSMLCSFSERSSISPGSSWVGGRQQGNIDRNKPGKWPPGVFLDWSHMTGEEADHFHEWGMRRTFLPRGRPPPRRWKVCKALPRGSVNYSTPPQLHVHPSSAPYPLCPLQEKRHWLIELFADGTIPTIFNFKTTPHKSKQTFLLPEWLMQFNIFM